MAGESLRSAVAVDKLLSANGWTILAGEQDTLAHWVVEFGGTSWLTVAFPNLVVGWWMVVGTVVLGWPYPLSLIPYRYQFAFPGPGV